MKLELKHLDFVNNGKVKLSRLPHFEFKEVNLQDCRLEFSIISKEPFLRYILRYKGVTFRLNQVTPYKRPLSDLTKEIEHNGETFVPIVELFKMRTQHLSDSIDKIYIENDTAILKLQKQTHPDQTISYCEFFEIDIEPEAIKFSLVTEYYRKDSEEIIKEEFNFIGNEFKMLKKLYEWHFDIDGLLKKGLAIEKQ